ncbi:MAG TPA: OsmC family protein [Actinomycetota bacterium]|nr:OsmC family protein [Actinomycetota bacterium]
MLLGGLRVQRCGTRLRARGAHVRGRGRSGPAELRRIPDGPRPGFTEIRVRSRVRARNASAEELEELCRYVQDTSPVRDILANPVPVTTSIEVL